MLKLGQLNELVAIVTGASSGIGRATALLFASEGASVVVADVDETGGHETVRLIAEKGGRSTFIKTDVTDSAQVNDMVLAAVETYGGLDILFANAGVLGSQKLITDTTDEDWEGVIDINLTGVFRSCRAAIPEIAKRGGGAIVVTASDVGIKPTDVVGPYCASKAGLISLTKTMAIECAPLKIRVNAVAPGETNTGMGIRALVKDQKRIEQFEQTVLLKRIAEPAEIAQVVLFLVTEASSYITGEVILADGGGMLHDASFQTFEENGK
jgi:NAD(P)-dependent dehydrogenase (short-subunit alcohol dehydrogenase family)